MNTTEPTAYVPVRLGPTPYTFQPAPAAVNFTGGAATATATANAPAPPKSKPNLLNWRKPQIWMLASAMLLVLAILFASALVTTVKQGEHLQKLCQEARNKIVAPITGVNGAAVSSHLWNKLALAEGAVAELESKLGAVVQSASTMTAEATRKAMAADTLPVQGPVYSGSLVHVPDGSKMHVLLKSTAGGWTEIMCLDDAGAGSGKPTVSFPASVTAVGGPEVAYLSLSGVTGPSMWNTTTGASVDISSGSTPKYKASGAVALAAPTPYTFKE